MNISPAELIAKYASRGILVDTNILLLYFVGTTNRNRIERFKRTKQFTANDYDILVKLLANFQKAITTPNVLTEVSSFINQLGEPERTSCYSIFANYIHRLEEHYLVSADVASLNWSFTHYGLTDCGLEMLAKENYLVLTDDLSATYYFLSQGVDALNFNNVRDLS